MWHALAQSHLEGAGRGEVNLRALRTRIQFIKVWESNNIHNTTSYHLASIQLVLRPDSLTLDPAVPVPRNPETALILGIILLVSTEYF